MTPTATCPTCDIGWRGPNAESIGLDHEKTTGHVVWFDEDPSVTETEDSGPLAIVWTVDPPDDECYCHEGFKQTDTVCMWCWERGRRHWNDPEVEATTGAT